MKKKDIIAIELFKTLNEKLPELKNDVKYDFSNTLKDYIKIYINPTSAYLESFKAYGIFYSSENFTKDKARINYIITDCILTIEKSGTYKPPITNNNFLSSIDNNTLWAIIAFLIVTLSTGAFYVGRFHERSELLFNGVLPNRPNTVSPTDSTINYKADEIRKEMNKNKIDSSLKSK